jgi:hypothetical protein
VFDRFYRETRMLRRLKNKCQRRYWDILQKECIGTHFVIKVDIYGIDKGIAKLGLANS